MLYSLHELDKHHNAEYPNIYIEFAVLVNFVFLYTQQIMHCVQKILFQTHKLCMQSLFICFRTQLLYLQCILADWKHSSCVF